MLFFELDFLILFLLPLLLIVVPLKALGFTKPLPWIASASSIAFLYAFSTISVAVALFSLLLNYFVAAYFLRHRSKSLLLLTVFINLAVLGYFKYSILIEPLAKLELCWGFIRPGWRLEGSADGHFWHDVVIEAKHHNVRP